MKSIKFLDLNNQYKIIQNEISNSIQKVFDNSSYIMGPDVNDFENNFAKYTGVNYCIGVGNGTDALEIAIQSLNIKNDDEVITQANTFVATCLGVTYNNAKLVLVDSDDNFMIKIDDIEKNITSKTKAIIVVHLYGHMCDMDKIITLCKKYNLYLIEDCAQAHGAIYKNKKAGSFGDVSCFSFYPGKNLGAYGDGGAICCNDVNIYENIKKIRNLGSVTKYYHEIIGRNSRLDTIQASILNVKLKYLDGWNKKRQEHANLYNELLCDNVNITLHKNNVSEPVWHLFVIRIKERNELKKYLEFNGIQTGVHYPIPIHKLECYSKEFEGMTFENTENDSNEILSLPMYPELSSEEIEYVCEKINKFYDITI